MSTLKADTIVASDGTSPVTLTKQSAAKAFAMFDQRGSYIAVNTAGDTLNASSFTDVGTGIIQHSFVNSMSGDEYSSITNQHFNALNSDATGTRFSASYLYTTGSYRTAAQYQNGIAQDGIYTLSVFGDLA